jgi:rod shape-determining protein MreD
MRIRNVLLLLLAAVLLATAVFPVVLPPALCPDVFACVVVFLGLRTRRGRVLQLCWATGMLRDVVFGSPLGSAGLVYLFAGLALWRVRRSLDMQRPPAVILAGALTMLLAELVALPFGEILVLPFHALAAGLLPLVLAALVTGAVTPAALWGLDHLKGWLGLRRRVVFGAR